MRRLYYLAEDVDTTERVSDALHAEGISDWNFHVIARDEAGLISHKIHSATTYQQLDFVHTGERFAIIGAGIGLAVGAVCYVLQPLPFATDMLIVALMAVIGGLAGACRGGVIGFKRENYKIGPFHDDIEAGRYLIMVDVTDKDRPRVRELMNMEFPTVQRCGSSSTVINPFDQPPRTYQHSTNR